MLSEIELKLQSCLSQFLTVTQSGLITTSTMFQSDVYCASLPGSAKLHKVGARECTVGSLTFLLLGPKNNQICPKRSARSHFVVPNNEVRSLNIYYKYADVLHWFRVRTFGFLRESPVLSSAVAISGIANLAWLNNRVVPPKAPPSLCSIPSLTVKLNPFTKTAWLNLPDAIKHFAIEVSRN